MSADSLSLSMGHNSIEHEAPAQRDFPLKLSGSQAKTKRAIEINIARMVREAGIERVAFATFTIGEIDDEGKFVGVCDSAEANRRANSLQTNLLPSIFRRWLIVPERHKSGAIHFHLVGELIAEVDIRTGYDWEAVRKGDYRSACPFLRNLWALLRERLPGYGFGRSQVEPVKGEESIACYVAKYVEKNLFNRLLEDRGKKLVRYGGWNGTHCRANDISWATEGARRWRKAAAKIAAPAEIVREDVAQYCGPKWAWWFTKIMGADELEHVNLLERLLIREVERTSKIQCDAFARAAGFDQPNPDVFWERRAA